MEVNMKSKKWIWVTLTILLTLAVLAGAAGAGYRMGLMQGARLTASAEGSAPQFEQFGHMRGFDHVGFGGRCGIRRAELTGKQAGNYHQVGNEFHENPSKALFSFSFLGAVNMFSPTGCSNYSIWIYSRASDDYPFFS
jgi:hypothetical protein